MSAPDLLDTANEPWRGEWWVTPPSSYICGLYRLHQIEAHHLLKRKMGLTNWSAYILQVIRYQHDDLKPIQLHWLRRIEREAMGEQA